MTHELGSGKLSAPEIDVSASSERASYYLPEQVSVHFYFTPHGAAEDAPHLRDRMADADIFAPETFAWEPETLKAYELISKGDYKTYQRWQQLVRDSCGPNSYTELQMSALYNRRITVIMFDIEERHPLTKAHREYLGLPMLAENLRPDFAQTIKGLRKSYEEKTGPIVRQREEYMLEKLSERIAETVGEHPKLQSKDDVSVLVTLGPDHTYIYHQLRMHHPNPNRVTREFDYTPVIYPYSVQCLRAGQFGVKLTEDVAARAYAEIIVQAIVKKQEVPLQGDNEAERQHQLIRVLGQLTFDEIGSLHERFNQALDSGEGYDLTHPVISKVVRELQRAV